MYTNTEEYSKLIKSVANAINELCGKYDLTYKEFAIRIGATPSMITNYTSGMIVPKSMIVVNIAKAFHVSTDWILGVSDKR